MKKIQVHNSFEDAEREVLEEGFKRTPEERVLWLLSHQKRMKAFSGSKLKSNHFELKRKIG